MRLGQPSRTAMATANARAYHQLADEPRVFTDPLAVPLVGESACRDNEFDRGADPVVVRRRRMFIAARSRFADDTIAAAIADGIGQVVILGAGMDTSAYRNPHPDVRFFEVDHPDTQAWKRQRIAEAGIAIPPTLTYAPIDFEQRTLADGLAAAGLDRARGAVFVWLGVVMYLTSASVTDTLGFIATHGHRSVLVLDYLYPELSLAPDVAASRQDRVARVADMGEPWQTYFTADEIRDQLLSLGFTDIEDHTAAALLAGYLGRPVPASSDTGVHMIRATTR
ncbi:class I SAM-dependent methyltransferase [Nocardia sp. NPDC052566]|uniref:class I SAM-dependent methyltransferase n=1 Tax=Nocardia sp. NPDC052566 TaxID=3364330 RepID=UPI0037C62662